MAVALVGAFGFVALTHWGSEARQVRPFLEEADRLAEMAGLGVQQAHLSGHRMTSATDIFDALDLGHARSLLRFDSVGARERIERLPWVKTATITRVFPDSVRIDVVERTPFAVWSVAGKSHLVDITGRVLGAVPPGHWTELPRIAGTGAATRAEILIEKMRHYPSMMQHLLEAELVAERRWTLKFAEGTEILLPADREAEALTTLVEEFFDSGRLDRYERIDLRSTGRIVVKLKRVETAKEPPIPLSRGPSG